ncbi:MAG: PP2C family protein-serine/threonine phosphatase, partial [Bryobacteraceae bacterium]|nr:PP2C family protein-serine/threonine phosphatase [Bryobacteraceae bacterium]
LLPATPPKVDGYSIAGSCIPAREVGGDLFDYAAAPSGKLALCVADVSGKGVPAALYMTLTKGMLASAQPKLTHLPALVSRLNKYLLATGKRKTFVTMSLAVLDPPARRLTHVRAGHNPPLLYRAATKTWELLKPRGLGLGLASPAAFDPLLEEQTVELQTGDVAVFYSDGLTEMMNPEREQFGEERLGEVVRENAGSDARQIHDAVLEAAREFQSGAEQHDDLTLLVLKAEYSLS